VPGVRLQTQEQRNGMRSRPGSSGERRTAAGSAWLPVFLRGMRFPHLRRASIRRRSVCGTMGWILGRERNFRSVGQARMRWSSRVQGRIGPVGIIARAESWRAALLPETGPGQNACRPPRGSLPFWTRGDRAPD